MKTMIAGIMTVCLLSGLSVCSAEKGVTGSYSALLRGNSVSEIAPGFDNSAGIALRAIANPNLNAVPDIEGEWARDVKLGSHDEFVANTTPPQVGIVFFARRPVRNFKVLALEPKGYNTETKRMVYRITELYAKDVLSPEVPLLVKTVLYGDMPNNGFSYTDFNGQTRYFAVNPSGEDGSLRFIEF